jgi:HD-like signal output (HDOD) protein
MPAPPEGFEPEASISSDQSLREMIEEEIRSGRAAPQVMPAVGARVQEVTCKEDYPLEELTDVIEEEPALAGRILRYANSSAYAGLAEITELDQAVTRLGTLMVESIAIAAATKEVYKARNEREAKIMNVLWKHAVDSGEIGRIIARETHPCHPEQAFLTCLLHDIGWVVIVRALGTIEERRRSPIPDGLRDEILDTLHADSGARLLESWSIPDLICEAVMYHHEPEKASRGNPLPFVANLSDAICHKLGAGQAPDENVSLLSLPSAEYLKLDDLQMAVLLVEAEDALSRAGHMD